MAKKKFSTTEIKQEFIDVDDKPCVIVELPESEVSKYRAEVGKGVKFDRKKGKVSMGEATYESESLLVQLCLHRCGPDGKTVMKDDVADPAQRFPLAAVKRWKSRIIRGLFKLAQEVNGLGEDQDEESQEDDKSDGEA